MSPSPVLKGATRDHERHALLFARTLNFICAIVACCRILSLQVLIVRPNRHVQVVDNPVSFRATFVPTWAPLGFGICPYQQRRTATGKPIQALNDSMQLPINVISIPFLD